MLLQKITFAIPQIHAILHEKTISSRKVDMLKFLVLGYDKSLLRISTMIVSVPVKTTQKGFYSNFH